MLAEWLITAGKFVDFVIPAFYSSPRPRLPRARSGESGSRGPSHDVLWIRDQVRHDGVNDQVRQAARGVIGSALVVVDAKAEPAASFYAQYDFQRAKSDPMRLYIFMGTIAKLP